MFRSFPKKANKDRTPCRQRRRRNMASRGIKPWFIKKLPSRVEILEGQTLALDCHVGSRGCKPWFVKKLPAQIEIVRGDELELKCIVGESDTQVIRTSEYLTESATRRELGKIVRREQPSAPPTLSVSHVTANSATIEWSKPYDDGGSVILHYVLEKREEGSTVWNTLTTLPPGAYECELENMAAGKDYFVRIVAVNKHGRGLPVELKQPIRVRGVEKEVPSRPGRPVVSEITDNSLTVSWEAPLSDGGCPVLQYILERREIRGPRWIRVHKSAVEGPTFTVNNLVEGSQYEFRVYARNVVGTSEASEMSKSVVCRDSEVEPPKFAGEMKDVTVQEGDSATFECRVSGNPMPEVKWFKNLKEAFSGYKHRVSQEDSLCSFTVNSVAPEDCGEIECRAYNKAGNASITARLNIHIPPKLKVSANILEGMNFSQNQPMRIRIPVIGRPFPRVIWTKDGEVIEQSEKYNLTTDESATLLVVDEPEKTDAGNYGIEVLNAHGQDRASFRVKILGHPDPPPGPPTMRDITDDSLRLDWEAPLYNGGDMIMSYRIEKLEGSTGKWTKCSLTHLTNAKIFRLKQNVEYRFRILAENIHGFSDPSPESDPVTLKEPKFEMDYDSLVSSPTSYSRVDLDHMIGDVDSKYIVCEEIGRGKHGVVHRAIERATGKNWAAKFFQYGQLERVMIRQELEIMNDLHHPRLLHLHEAFDSQGEISVILELLSGGDLLQRVTESDSGFTEDDVISWMRQICQGVAHLHKRNIVHLELKPENVLFVTSKSKDVKLVDFGLAQRVELDRTVRVGFGSADYCAPEIINYEPISFASDMWSLGVTAYTLLTGSSPFLGSTPRETFLNISHGHSPELKGKQWQYVSDCAKDWVQKLLQKEKSQRMTINQALAHPWLNGEAEGHISKISLPTDHHRILLRSQKWRSKYPCMLAEGRLAHQCAIYRRIAKHYIFERELTMDMPDREPQVVIELSGTEAYEGTTGRFKCKFQGKPEPTIKWYHEGQEVKSSQKYDLWYKRGLAMLNVNDVTRDDAGQYQCVATNSVTSCTTVGELHVHELGWRRRSLDLGKPVIGGRRRSLSFERDSWSQERRRSLSVEQLSGTGSGSAYGSGSNSRAWTNNSSGYGTGTFFNTVDSNIPPQVTLSLLDQALPVGEQCSMAVLVTCFPDPELAWFHNQERVQPSEKYTIEGERGFQRLTIQYVEPEDAGSWRCLAFNSYGQAMTTCKLTVLDNLPSGSTLPKVVPQLIKAVALEGSTARLEWKVSGTPEPQLQWYKDRQAIPDSEHYHGIYDRLSDSHSLLISNTLHEDSGYYGCGAANAAGTAFMETQLVVEGQ